MKQSQEASDFAHLQVKRPEPITASIPVLEYHQGIDPQDAAAALLEGNYVLISDQYSSGLLVTQALREKLVAKNKNHTFQEQRDFRDKFRSASQKLLVEIVDYRLQIKKAPSIGWIERLYIATPDFLLPFSDIQGLNSSWQWYVKGIRIPGLKKSIHPFYGTYFPTRFEHIDLFIDWLKTHNENRQNAFEVGIGSGVLSNLLHQFHYEQVSASDIHPNAILGILEAEKNTSLKTNLYFGDLFAEDLQFYDLIVFNPPWIPLQKEHEGMDLAMYYDDQLFPRFFEAAKERLGVDGKIVLLFSNLAGLMDPKFEHPIQKEMDTNHRFQLHALTKKKTGAASKKTTRNARWRDEEYVECWILEHYKEDKHID